MTDPTREDVLHLTTAAEENQRASERLAAAIRLAFRPFRVLLWGLVALMLLQLVGTGMQIVGIRNIIDGRAVSRQTNATILDCTNPEGECAKKGQARSAVLVAELAARLAEAVRAGGYCTYQPTPEDFNACTDAAFARIAAEAAARAAATAASGG
jgi:hypothetical protein